MNNNVSRKEEKEYKKVDPAILASSGAFGGRRTKLKKSTKKSKKSTKKSKKSTRKARTMRRR